MRKLIVLLAFCVSTLESQTNTALVTVFREDHRNPLLNFGADVDADKAKMLAVHVMLDGKLLLVLRSGRFATLRIPSGKHEITIEKKLGEGALQIDAAPGKHLYVRPGLHYKHAHLMVLATPMEIACDKAIEAGRETEPSKNKDIGAFPALDEGRFPAECTP